MSLHTIINFSQLRVQTTQKKNAPKGMIRGSTVSDNDIVYLAPDGSNDIYCYQVKEDKWTKSTPRCPHKDFGLVILGKELVAIGGVSDDGVTGRVLTLRKKKWIQELPPLIQPRYDAAVVSTDSHLLTIGGKTSDSSRLSSVELLRRGDPAWTSLTSLPTATGEPSATLIGQSLYIFADNKNVYFSSLDGVLASKKPLTPLLWQRLPPFPPVRYPYTPSSCSLAGQLVIVDGDGAIYYLLQSSWKSCGQLSGGFRRYCLLATPSPDTMVAVGGGDWLPVSSSDIVDVCIVV